MKLKKEKTPICDLHCDLLFYLTAPHRTIFDPESRASLVQMLQGGVETQTMAVFVKTEKKSHIKASRQLALYHSLHERYPEYFKKSKEKSPDDERIRTRLAIENASSLATECEPFDKVSYRLRKIVKEIEKPLYISLTWNDENRFGGGASSDVGLKDDGKELLRVMAEWRIPVDVSHASDQLAEDVLRFIDLENLSLRVLASHSNFRPVKDAKRNLPRWLSDEIVKRDGVIGLNFVQKFVGKTKEALFDHIEYALSCGYENHLALGADYFYEKQVFQMQAKQVEGPITPYFFDELSDASCYGNFTDELVKKFSKKVGDNITHLNFQKFEAREQAS